MDEFWEKKVDEVVKISKGMGYKDLDKEFWINKPAILTSFKTLNKMAERLEQLIKESKKNER